MSAAILLDEQQIRQRLSAEAMSALTAIHIFPELPSTNAWLLAQGGCGAVCLTEAQTAGRGRRGRSWQSPARQNVYLSLRWCFAAVPQYYGSLSLVVGLAVAQALDALGIERHGLKWPNDIYHQGKKLGGVLLQTAAPLQQVVIGIGLNVNMQPAEAGDIDQPWCSLRTITDNIVDRNRVVAQLLNALLPRLSGFTHLARAQLVQEWQCRDILADRAVTVHQAQQALPGMARGINAEGELVVELEDGSMQAFSAADVSIRFTSIR